MPLTRRRVRSYHNYAAAGGVQPSFNTSTHLWQVDGGSTGSGVAYASGTKLVIPIGLVNPCLVLFLHSYHAVNAGGVRLDSSSGAAFTPVVEAVASAQRAALYVMPAPATDGVTSHTIWVDTDYRLGEAILAVYEHVHQTTPTGTPDSKTTSGTSAPFSVAPPSAVGDLVIATISAGTSLSGVTQDGSLTNVGGGPFNSSTLAVQGFSKAGASPSTTVGFTTDGARAVALVAAALKAA